MCLPHVSLIFKKISPKTFGLHCVCVCVSSPKCRTHTLYDGPFFKNQISSVVFFVKFGLQME